MFTTYIIEATKTNLNDILKAYYTVKQKTNSFSSDLKQSVDFPQPAELLLIMVPSFFSTIFGTNLFSSPLCCITWRDKFRNTSILTLLLLGVFFCFQQLHGSFLSIKVWKNTFKLIRRIVNFSCFMYVQFITNTLK